MSEPSENLDLWHLSDKNAAHERVFKYVRKLEEEQGDTYDRLAYLEALYDPYSPSGDDTDPTKRLANVSENVVANNVDTVYASVATAEVRARFLTDNADWSVQRRAKKMEFYSEGLGKLHSIHRKARIAFKEASKKGGGLVKVFATRWGELAVEHTPIEDIVVPDSDTRCGAPPLQLHHVQRLYDKEKLKAEFPEHAEAIEDQGSMRSMSNTTTSSFRATEHNKLTVIESIRLPMGKRPSGGDTKKKGKKGEKPKWGARYVPGRRVVCIDSVTLLDEEYHKPFYPFAMVTWSERLGSFYGISGAERIAGIQRTLNKRNWQIERVLDQNALLTTFVRPSDANFQTKTTRIGNVAVIKGEFPHTPSPPLVASETYNSRQQLKDSAGESFGSNRLPDGRATPAGLETGAAVREWRGAKSERFAPQEADFEQLILDITFLMTDVCKDLGDDAPDVLVSRWHKPIVWKDVDLGQVRVQMEVASTLPRSAAGREQTVVEWAQAGIISTDSAKRLIGHPDLERELSLYTSALEVIEMQIEMILDGESMVPEPYDNLAMTVWRGTASYNNARLGHAPEEVLENLRDFISHAAWTLDQQRQQQAAAAAAAAAPPPGPGALPPGDGGELPAGPPGVPAEITQPQAALAPEAMQLMAGRP